MTKSSVKKVTSESLSDFLKVLNADRMQINDHTPLSLPGLKKALKDQLVFLDDMLLGYEGTIPVSTARLVSGTRHEAFLCDLSVMPGRRSGGQALVEQLLGKCRERDAESIVAWLSENDFRFTDILSSFTFEPHRVRVRMRALLKDEPAPESPGSIKIVGGHTLPEEASVRQQFALGRNSARDLAEIMDDLENNWCTVIVAGYEELKPIVVGQISGSDRRLSQIIIDESSVLAGSSVPLTKELIRGVLSKLYHVGSREVRCETDSDMRLKTVLMDAGLVPDLTLFQFVLDLAQETRR